MMQRTTIMLPEDLKAAAEERAHRTRRSLGQLIRDALEKELSLKRKKGQRDLLLEDIEVYKGKTPRDLASNHDEYLYGDKK